MNIKIVKNKYLNALFVLMLFSAIVHMLILFYIAMATGDFYVINYFNIISITYFLPDFFNNLWGNIVSIVFVAAIYFLILKINVND
mgnify:CR=1 FL=1